MKQKIDKVATTLFFKCPAFFKLGDIIKININMNI